MNTLVGINQVRAVDVRIEPTFLRSISGWTGYRYSLPLVLGVDAASMMQRKNWRFVGDGVGIDWEDIDEDLSVASLLKGQKAPNPPRP